MNYTLKENACIHCDWQVNYYSEVKELASTLWIQHNAGLEGDDLAPHWDTFVEEAIDIIAQDKNTQRTCLNCDSPFSYL
jgi:hypothetical protein